MFQPLTKLKVSVCSSSLLDDLSAARLQQLCSNFVLRSLKST